MESRVTSIDPGPFSMLSSAESCVYREELELKNIQQEQQEKPTKTKKYQFLWRPWVGKELAGTFIIIWEGHGGESKGNPEELVNWVEWVHFIFF